MAKEKILIIVKTYPVPSSSYGELVCTTGVLENGNFIRLYPIDYRYRAYWEWYKKYQWVEVDIEKNTKDPRPESFRPRPGTRIIQLTEPLPTANKWEKRKKHVLLNGVQTMCELQTFSQKVRSLGIIKPKEIIDIEIGTSDRNWKPSIQQQFKQLHLFGPAHKPLEKIPYDFSYVFKCEHPKCNGHKMTILDWELGQNYRNMRDKYDENTAVEKVKQKFLNQMCAPNIDTHFFVGTVLQFGTWVVLGVFWPKK